MSRLEDLYQELILDHNRNPRNARALTEANRHSHGLNPLCGDDYYLFLLVNRQGIIQDVSFMGSGCAISKASTSMMTVAIKGKTLAEAEAIKQKFVDLVTKDTPAAPGGPSLGSLAVLEGVKQFPIRVKCATLIWRALEDAMKNKDSSGEITTE